MSLHTQAIVLNDVPLVVLSALYLGMAGALAPMAWREWRRATALELAFLSLFPAFPPGAVLVRWKERRQLIDGWLNSKEASPSS